MSKWVMRTHFDIYVPRAFQWYNFSIKWVLTPTIALWRFGSPLGFQLPKVGVHLECEGSFPHTLLHSRENEMWLPGFIFGPHLRKPLLGHEPKARVTTLQLNFWITSDTYNSPYIWCNSLQLNYNFVVTTIF
jgi:hypothetical protein